MKIEQATLHDLEKLAILFNDYRVFYEKPADLAGARNFLNERITRNESVIFISRNEAQTITGFIQLYPIFSSTRLKRLWLLNDLYVNKAFRGTGTAVALMDAAKQLAMETVSCGLVLETAKTNDVANKLYQRIGFKVDNDHNYYSWTE